MILKENDKDPVLLKLSNNVMKQYDEIFINDDKTITEIRARLTRNYILGTFSKRQSTDKYHVRHYGNLKIVVDITTLTIISLWQNIGDRSDYINNIEKKELTKLYKNVKEIY